MAGHPVETLGHPTVTLRSPSLSVWEKAGHPVTLCGRMRLVMYAGSCTRERVYASRVGGVFRGAGDRVTARLGDGLSG